MADARRLLCCAGSLDGGGSERQLWQLLCHVDREQLQPQVHLLYRRGLYLSRLPTDVKVHAVDQQSPPHWNWPGRLHAMHVRHLSHALIQEAIDVVYDRTYHSTLMTAPACRRTGCPRVSVIVSPPSHDLGRSRERFRWFKRRLLAKAYADPHAETLAVSQAVADDSQKYYALPPKKIRVVPSPIDVKSVLELSRHPLESTRSSSGRADRSDMQSLRVTIVARLTAEKGHAVLFKTLAQLRKDRPDVSVQLDVIGDGPLLDELKSMANSLGLQSNIHFLGYQNNPYPSMLQADVVCVPSRYEGLSNVALEAMVLGVPIILSRCNESMKELAGSNEVRGGLFQVDDDVDLCQQLKSVVERPALWQQRAQAASTWARERRSLEGWIAHMTSILLELSERYRRRGLSR